MFRIFSLALPLVLVLAAAACETRPTEPAVSASPPSSEPTAAPDAPMVSTGSPGPTGPSAVVPPRSALETRPTLSLVGDADRLPTAVRVTLDQPVARAGKGDAPAAGTRLRLDPEVPGRLVAISDTELVFMPAAPFAHGRRYQARLEALQTPEGMVRPSPAQVAGWELAFETPAFGFLGMHPERMDYARKEVALVARFSGPVHAPSLGKAITLEVDGKVRRDAQVALGDDPTQVAIRLSGGARPGAQLRLAMTDAVRSGLDPTQRAQAAEARFVLPEGKPVRILSTQLVEGDTGFYLEVICNDDASGGRRYHWSRRSEWSGYVSRRCQLTEEDAARLIRTEPQVAVHAVASGGGFRLLGDFPRGPLTLNIAAGATTVDGGVLMQGYTHALTVPARAPRLRFVSTGRYLPRGAWSNLGVQHMNVDEVQVRVRQIPPENLVFWLSHTGSETADARTSDLLVSTQVKLQNPPDRQHTSFVDLGALLPQTARGVLEVTLQHEGASAVSRLLLTDMSLVAKKGVATAQGKGRHDVSVWAVGIRTAAPLSGVQLQLKRMSGKTVATCTTDKGGHCRLEVPEVPEGDADDSAPFAIVARKGDDLTYLRYSDLRTETSDFDVVGEAFASERVYRAAVWSDRGVYRPGETARIAALLRDREDTAPRGGVPLELRLLDPREKVVRQLQLHSNEAGMVEASFPFAPFADTGRYRVELSVGKKTVQSYAFNVEEFVPERMKVEARPLSDAYLLGDATKVAVSAQYLFGGSAEGSRVQGACRLEPATFRPKQNAHFRYGLQLTGPAPKALTLGEVESSLDPKGQAVLECPALSGAAAFPGMARLYAQVAVFESGSGRSTRGEAQAQVHPEKFYLGLLADQQKFEPGVKLAVQGVVVDWEGRPAPTALTEVEVELVRMESEYGYFWDEDAGGERYQRHLRPVTEGTLKVPVKNGRFELVAEPRGWAAAFVVRVRGGQARTDLFLESTRGDWWWDYGTAQVDQTPKPLKPTQLAVQLPGELEVGKPVPVTVKAPFKGRVLFTAETDRVIAHGWVDAAAGDVSWSFPLERFFPNVYVSAFLIKDPHLESKESFLPDRAFGVSSAKVAPRTFTQPLTLSAPAEARSNSTLEVKLDFGKTDGPTWATVAVVDEGILSLTGFRSPNPFEAIFSRRALGVETYETIGWTLLMPPSGNTRRTGGDEEDEEGGAENARVQPVKPVALWSGLVKVPASGVLTLPFAVPQYRGKLRVMAVAGSPGRMAHAHTQVVVKDPLVLQTTLPRFVIHGDVLQIPVFVTNLSGAAQDIRVSLTAESLPQGGLEAFDATVAPLVFLGKPEGTARVENGKSATLVFQARAALTVGAARLQVKVVGGGHESREELDVPFVPNGPRERVVQKVALTAGKLDLKPYLAGWLPTSERSTFWVTSNPYGESFDHLAYLVTYPYGCLEQTTSSTRPLLFVKNLLQSVDPTLVAQGGKLEDMVMHGVNRVLSMQTPSGAFGYWIGDTQPAPWASAYATHMLLDAQRAGYPVPQDRLESVLGWMEREVARYERGDRSGETDWYGSAEAYMHYVLAQAGKGKKARIQKLIDHPQPGTSRVAGTLAEQQFMLKAALYLAGDRRYEKELKAPDASPVEAVRQNDWSFYSELRRRGFMLSTFQDLFGNDPAGEALAQRVADTLRGKASSRFTTQELVWSVTGLGKRVAEASREFKVGALSANGKKLRAQHADGRGGERTWSVHRASEYAKLELEVEDLGKGQLFLILSSEGVKKDARWKTGGEGLRVTRRYRTLDGAAVEKKSVSLADLLFVEVEIANTTGARVQNIALVDRLPAGFEIENPRLGRGVPVSWLEASETWATDAMNVRDDRLEVFGALGPGEKKKVVYAVRAVTAGAFTLPPVEAEAMYDPGIWAREPGATVEIHGGWEDFLL
jgi:uncharacterized protein YfaS (alpha-2-macroglobulin family)